MTNFDQQLALGKVAEGLIASWLRNARGRSVMPVYELITNDNHKGPQVFMPDGSLVAPDLLVLPDKKKGAMWAETKYKTHFAWYRQHRCWTTGIDAHHYPDYLAVRKRYAWPLWLLFLHESKTPSEEDQKWGCPSECPVGLFGQEILRLESAVDNTTDKHGRHGMVYWGQHTLDLLADLDEVKACCQSALSIENG